MLPRQFSLELDTWLAMHEDLRTSPRCAVTYAALADGITRHIAGQRAASFKPDRAARRPLAR